MKSSKRIVPLPNLSNFLTNISMRLSDNLYPKLVKAVFNSCLSMFPELSLSKFLKHCCQSVTYFQRAPKSWNETVPEFCRSNIPIIRRTVSGLKGLQVPLDKATCNSSAEIKPELSLSTLCA